MCKISHAVVELLQVAVAVPVGSDLSLKRSLFKVLNSERFFFLYLSLVPIIHVSTWERNTNDLWHFRTCISFYPYNITSRNDSNKQIRVNYTNLQDHNHRVWSK